MKRGKVNKSFSHGCFIFLDQIFGKAKISQLCFYLLQEERCLISDEPYSIQCLFCAEFVETGDSIAVSGRLLRDLRGTHCKFLGCELQTSNEDLQNVCKKYYLKLKKIEKMISNLKSLEDELRAEMSKNAVVRIKRGLSRARSNSGISVARSLETKPAKKALFLTSPPQDQTRFPSPVTAGRVVTSLTGTGLGFLQFRWLDIQQ